MKRIIWINVGLGLWLVLAPFVLGYGRTGAVDATVNDTLVGLLVAAGGLWIGGGEVSAVAVAIFEALCGVWLLMAPFVLGVSHLERVTVNDLLVGLVVLLVGLATMVVSRTPVKP